MAWRTSCESVGVPTEQISVPGHLPDESPATTSIYAPYEPGFLSDAVDAIESVMADMPKHLKRALTDKPELDSADLAASRLIAQH
jgi:hypothetical protein